MTDMGRVAEIMVVVLFHVSFLIIETNVDSNFGVSKYVKSLNFI